MELYVKMNDAEYESYKESLKHKDLKNYTSTVLAAALLECMQTEGANLIVDDVFNSPFTRRSATSATIVNKDNVKITIRVEK